MNNFITNQQDVKTLKTRIKSLIEHSEELKFLVGFFYFSGWKELYANIINREDLDIKILVGLQVDDLLGQSVEFSHDVSSLSIAEKVDNYFHSLSKALNSEDLDIQEFYEQIDFFIELIEKEKLQIKKTADPNHAKLYIFKIKETLKGITDCKFITGSSNLTKAGLENQQEFNVEIGDYGLLEAEKYFDDLWDSAIPITQDNQRKSDLIHMIRHHTQAATVSPFEAYILVLITYLDVMEQKHIRPDVLTLLRDSGYTSFQYQIDAVDQALSIIENYNGAIIADVVGLGKSVIAGMICRNLGKRGLIICPPGLICDRNATSGWRKYIHDFKLHDWEIRSSGDLEKTLEYVQLYGDTIEIVLIDEAHRFRNQDTANYEFLSSICRNRKVLLLTATPFNNSPADIFSMLKLFIIPGKSRITLDDNLEIRFNYYNSLFRKLSYILKNYNSDIEDKIKRCKNYYLEIFGDLPIDLNKVKSKAHQLSRDIRRVIEPVVIRRNRLDLRNDPIYKTEISQLSEMKDPVELFFYLSHEQSEFYDEVINDYFGEEKGFTGAIYQPFLYEKVRKSDKMDMESNRTFQQQRNLFDFMRRLLVKRFESSFGSFAQSIKSFIRVHNCVIKFIEKSGGKYILDRKLIEKIYENDPDEIETALIQYAELLENEQRPKHDKIYNVDKFELKHEFFTNIQNDLALFEKLSIVIKNLNLVKNDPKIIELIAQITDIINSHELNEPERKVVIFSEYIATVNHITPFLEAAFPNKVLSISDNLSDRVVKKILRNFDASISKSQQLNDYQILVASDKLSEGFNLNRAGAIINYDIPWNPTRVIQRVGRINRIGNKVFNELHIYNFFPTEQGADIVKSKQIASQKMFLIHNTLGEDAKIFEVDETPSASSLYKRININPDVLEEESILTKIRKIVFDLKSSHPDLISKVKGLPVRVKTAKSFHCNEVLVFRKKGLGLFIQYVDDSAAEKPDIYEISIDDSLEHIECSIDEPKLKQSKFFWPVYEQLKVHSSHFKLVHRENSLEQKSINNLKSALKFFKQELIDELPFIRALLKDLLNFRTLPKYSLRRIILHELSPKSSKTNLSKFQKEINDLHSTLGANYIDLVEHTHSKIKNEIIIAVENIYLQ
ncbi:MAG: helicase [Candidatus Atribacteria bacterium]|nr:helicase [Candidatus Atribacteria bacterium]